jgi:hypothetical protein
MKLRRNIPLNFRTHNIFRPGQCRERRKKIRRNRRIGEREVGKKNGEGRGALGPGN